jgi:hypothetical protein
MRNEYMSQPKGYPAAKACQGLEETFNITESEWETSNLWFVWQTNSPLYGFMTISTSKYKILSANVKYYFENLTFKWFWVCGLKWVFGDLYWLVSSWSYFPS